MKKTTLLRLLTILFSIAVLTSCSKHTDKPAIPGGDGDGGNPPPVNESYFIKMKMDGAQQSFASGVKAIRTVDNGTYLLQIQGIKSANSTDEMDLLVYAPNEVNAGDYIEGDHDTYYILGVYAPQNRTDDLGIYFGGIHLNDAAPFKIKITEMTDKYVKGTFSGTYYDNEGNGDNKKVITEGEFKAPLK